MAQRIGCQKRCGSSDWKAPRGTAVAQRKVPDTFVLLTPFSPLFPLRPSTSSPGRLTRRPQASLWVPPEKPLPNSNHANSPDTGFWDTGSVPRILRPASRNGQTAPSFPAERVSPNGLAGVRINPSRRVVTRLLYSRWVA
jgi:hypothetical protein